MLHVLPVIRGVSKAELRRAQLDDQKLKEVRNRVFIGEKRTTSNCDVHWYEQHNGLLYNMFRHLALLTVRYTSS